MNSQGHSKTLEARHEGNMNAFRSGVYSPRYLAEFAEPFVEEVMAATHIEPIDRFAVEETGLVRGWISLMDDDLLRKGLFNRKGEPRTLLTHRLRASKQLERYLVELALTPNSRSKLRSGDSVGQTYVRLLAEEQTRRSDG